MSIYYLVIYLVGFVWMWILSLRADKRNDIEFNFFETLLTAAFWPFFAVVIPCMAIHTFLSQRHNTKK
ncbi:Uncharacterised protein [Cedecea lapagei]|uniref:Inner membrane protein n=1 Tax=Cedecea lapagei TaxID=158823 RepID=A0A3S4JCM8_9ENTR|nr:Uncharacterised protein [Cedecea lapagei]